MEVAPLLEGVNVAVYTVELTAVKLLIAPLPSVMSDEAKFEVASLLVKVSVSVASFVVDPLATLFDPSVAVIVIVGTVVSITKFLLDASAFESSSAGKFNVALFPAALKGLDYQISKKIEWIFTTLAVFLLVFTLWYTM